ncbi:MAG: class I SAM-dependent methyltransferase [Anaerolineales bacterium]|jgi:hypothetical protein
MQDSINHSTLTDLIQLLGRRARPEISWVAQVAGCSLERAQQAVNEITQHAAAVIELCEQISQTGRTYYAQFPAPIELFALVRLTLPKNLVESGVSSGVSSTFMLLGLASNQEGVLHSIDFPIERQASGSNPSWSIPSGFSSGWAVPELLKQRWNLHLGRSEDLLQPLLNEVGAVDLFCHDSPVDEKHFEFEMTTVVSYLKPGSLVVSDNVDKKIFNTVAQSVGTKAIYRRKSSLAAFRVPNPTG